MLNYFSSKPSLRNQGGEFVLDFFTFRDGHAVPHTLVLGDVRDAARFLSCLCNDFRYALTDKHSLD